MHCARILYAALVVAAASTTSHAAITFRTVALTGTPFPDASGSTAAASSAGQTFGVLTPGNAFSNVVANASGKVAFQSTFAGTGIVSGTNNAGVFSEGSGSTKMLSRRGNTSVDAAGAATPGVNYNSTILGPNINAAGESLFTMNLSGTGITTTGTASNNNAVFFASLSGTRKIVQLNDPVTVAGSPMVVRSVGGVGALNSSGQLVLGMGVYVAGSASSGTNSMWRYSGGSLQKIAAAGESAAGTDIGTGSATYSASGWNSQYVLNASGMTGYAATLVGGANGVVTGVNDRGIWVTDTAGTPSLLVRGGTSAPGTAGTFSTFGTAFGLNAAGTAVFLGNLATAGSITTANNAGIWKGTPSSGIALVMQKGSQAAGYGAGVNYSAVNAPIIGKPGYIAVVASITGTGITTANDTALFAETPSGLVAVAAEGTAAGTTGKFFGSFSSSTAFDMNADGKLAFLTTVTDTIGGSATSTNIFAQDFYGNIQLIAQTGATLEVSPGVFKTVSSLTFNNVTVNASGGEDGRASAWSDNYNLTFSALFSDGSSAVMSASVPEPSNALIPLAAALPLLSRRRRTC